MENFLIRFITHYAINLPRFVKRILAVFLDMMLCAFALWIALSIHFYEFAVFGWQHLSPILISISIAIPIFYLWGLYRAIFRYSGNRAMITLLKAIVVYVVIYFLLFLVIDFDKIPRSISIMQPILLFLLVGSSRWLV